jgi:DNA-binding MarR family transcriptional regulator
MEKEQNCPIEHVGPNGTTNIVNSECSPAVATPERLQTCSPERLHEALRAVEASGHPGLGLVFQRMDEKGQERFLHLCAIDYPIGGLANVLKNQQQSLDLDELQVETSRPVQGIIKTSDFLQRLVGITIKQQQSLDEPKVEFSQPSQVLSKNSADIIANSIKSLRKRPPKPFVQRVAYVLKSNPVFEEFPWLVKTPPLIQRLVRLTKEQLPEIFWDYLHALRKALGKRWGMSKHRALAILAIVRCLLSTMNTRSLQCINCSVSSIAKQCGLTVARASRALDDIANVGFITKQLKRSEKGTYQPLIIHIAKKLLKVLGVSDKELQQAQKLHKELSKPTSQPQSFVKKIGDTMRQSLRKLKRSVAAFNSRSKEHKAYSTTQTIVQTVDDLVQVFRLGLYRGFSPG